MKAVVFKEWKAEYSQKEYDDAFIQVGIRMIHVYALDVTPQLHGCCISQATSVTSLNTFVVASPY
jgi:hypothetical protein